MPKKKSHPEGFYDLAASLVRLESQTQRERVATLDRLGYHALAICHNAVPPLKDNDRC